MTMPRKMSLSHMFTQALPDKPMTIQEAVGRYGRGGMPSSLRVLYEIKLLYDPVERDDYAVLFIYGFKEEKDK